MSLSVICFCMIETTDWTGTNADLNHVYQAYCSWPIQTSDVTLDKWKEVQISIWLFCEWMKGMSLHQTSDSDALWWLLSLWSRPSELDVLWVSGELGITSYSVWMLYWKHYTFKTRLILVTQTMDLNIWVSKCLCVDERQEPPPDFRLRRMSFWMFCEWIKGMSLHQTSDSDAPQWLISLWPWPSEQDVLWVSGELGFLSFCLNVVVETLATHSRSDWFKSLRLWT